MLAAGAHDPSPVLLSVFLLAGLVAVWAGVNWAFDVRGIATRRSERIRRRNADAWAAMGRLDGSPTMFGSVGYLRFLGVLMAFAGLVMLLAAYALWRLG
ncbi:hypothetical protein EOT10_33185 [Streptomyces antnestii]|uniref:Uncharacterized protein n=1 Tax=Streptomyces antnestii TaxID=2494256 RepID=A0A3S2WAJ2_9ACTN|nr:hypothetical protein [Streptomyces sp. San01]RVU17956.1 hypothetical protein EOT10_33185 [Streptomyces sp. San01]